MSEALDHKTFDLAAVLAGQEYPEDTVEVYFNEKLGFTINKVTAAIAMAERRNDAEVAEALQKDLDDLVAKVADAKYTIHLRGIDPKMKKDLLKSVHDEFPPKRNLFGQEEENLEADESYTRKLWATFITRVEDPSGAISLMSEELAQLLQDKAPESAQKEINRGIKSLSDDAVEGFAFASKEVDFLLTALPEG